MFPEDADMERSRDWILANSCYRFDGIWNFPKQPDKKIIEVKYIFNGLVLPDLRIKSGFRISENDETSYQKIYTKTIQNTKLYIFCIQRLYKPKIFMIMNVQERNVHQIPNKIITDCLKLVQSSNEKWNDTWNICFCT